MQNHYTIRKGSLNDLAELQRLFVETITTVCTANYDEQQIKVWASSVDNKKRWHEVMIKQFVIVAQYGNKITGFATLDNGNYLDFLYVHKDHQRQGVAQLLLDTIEAEAKRLNQNIIRSDISKTAKPFFERNGFKTLKEQTNVRQGIEIINYKMTKQL
jgi:putative acetyltransferase